MGKTIRQIADEIGVSKQAIFKKIKCEPMSTSLQDFITTVDGRLLVSIDGENLIKQAFKRNVPLTKLEENTPIVDDKFAAQVNENNTLYEILKIELDAKNELIKKQQETIDKLTNTISEQAQSINADNQTQLAQKIIEGQQFLEGAADRSEQNSKAKQKKSFLSNFFQKRENHD